MSKKIRQSISIFLAIFVGFVFAYSIRLTFQYFGFQFENYNSTKNVKAEYSENIENFKKEEGFIIPKREVKKENNFSETYQSKSLNFISYDIPNAGKVIIVDLENMFIETLLDGTKQKEYKILAVGRDSSAGETTPGYYEVLSKEKNHFSSITKVRMPYSMQFFGNQFIHGRPYYSNGTKLSSEYSGGCIQLSDQDIVSLYSFADIKTPVIIKGKIDEKNYFNYKSSNFLDDSKISADAYLIADLETGEVIDSKNSEKQYPIASITKLMTALIYLETINQYAYITIPQVAVDTFGEAGDLIAGEILQIGELIYPLLFESSNDTAEAIALYRGRNLFISDMNKKAQSIGLKNTFFEDPSGISSNNVSNAEDLFVLIKYIYNYKDYIFNISNKKNHSYSNHTWESNSDFIDDADYLGGKSGYTTIAKNTLISVFDVVFEGKKRKIVFILLKSESPVQDIKTMKDFLKNNVVYE